MAGTIQSTLNFKVRKNRDAYLGLIDCGQHRDDDIRKTSDNQPKYDDNYVTIGLKPIDVGSSSPPRITRTPLRTLPATSQDKFQVTDCELHDTLTRGQLDGLYITPSSKAGSSNQKSPDELSPSKMNKSPRKRRNSPWVLSPKHSDENSPSPRKKERQASSSIAPLQLFNQDVSNYQALKSVLVTTGSNIPLPCREKEIAEISKFLECHLIGAQPNPGSMYISGAPGTGKTACLNQILQAIKFEKCGHKIVTINCMTLRAVNAIYERIYEEIRLKETNKCRPVTTKSVTSMQRKLKNLLTNGAKQMILLILDEIDYLDSKDQQILYTIFEWPALENSRLVLIGIANALDLTDRVLPRLHGRANCRPRLLHFAPYSYEQCLSILKSRLQQVPEDGRSIIKPAALQFCARKVASVSGDIRKALDICRRAVELVEADVMKQKILFPLTLNSGCLANKGIKSLTTAGSRSKVASNATVELSLIVSILNNVYGNKLTNQIQNGGCLDGRPDKEDIDNDNSLPFHQKVLLCTLLLIIKKGKSKEVTIGKFHEVYCRICKKRQLSHLEQSDFSNVCSLVELRGLIGIKNNKSHFRQSKVSLKVDENEIAFALKDRTLLSSILEDIGCI